MKLSQLKEAPYNPRKIADVAFVGLKASLAEFGDLSGFTWNARTGQLVCGHQRLRGLKERFGAENVRVVMDDAALAKLEPEEELFGSIEAGSYTFPLRVVHWTLPKEKAANVTANNYHIAGDFTEELETVLADIEAEFDAPEDLGFETLKEDRFGYDDADIEAAGRNVDQEEYVSEVGVAGSLILAYKEEAQFPSSTPWGLPDLREDMLAETYGTEMWIGGPLEQAAEKTVFLWGSNKFGTFCKGGTLCFYVDDVRFESVWNEAVSALNTIQGCGFGAVMAPDFSTWADWPLALRFYNIYRSRWCARYWQEAGVKVIPSIQAVPSDIECALDGIPVDAPVISMQCRTAPTAEDKKNLLGVFPEVLEYLNPKVWLLYGGKEHRAWLEPNLPKGPRYVFLSSWSKQRFSKVYAAKKKAKGA